MVGVYQENHSLFCPEESLRVSIWEYMGAVPFIHSVSTNKGTASLGVSFSICGLCDLYLGVGESVWREGGLARIEAGFGCVHSEMMRREKAKIEMRSSALAGGRQAMDGRGAKWGRSEGDFKKEDLKE